MSLKQNEKMSLSAESFKSFRLSDFCRRRIISMSACGTKIIDIKKKLEAEDGIIVNRRGIGQFLKRYRKNGYLLDRPRRINRRHLLGLNEMNFIDQAMEEDAELSARELSHRIKTKFNINVSVATVKRVRRKLGWRKKKTRYCQLIRAANRPKRFMWCQKMLKSRETFDDVIFSDESKVVLQTTTNYEMVKEGREETLHQVAKHPTKVYVWAAISKKGASTICVFTGIMNSEFYQEILSKHLVPFINSHYPTYHRFQQDNDPKHVSKSTKAFMTENNINHWPTPPESPDLNPIENIWAKMKFHLRRHVKPKNKAELVAGILTFWKTVTPHICRKYIGHLKKVMPYVILRKGAASGF